MSKLTTEERDTLKHWLHLGVRQSDIAKAFDVSRAYVTQVKQRIVKRMKLSLDTQ